jgi:hypothetical protein
VTALLMLPDAKKTRRLQRKRADTASKPRGRVQQEKRGGELGNSLGNFGYCNGSSWIGSDRVG